MKDVFAHNRDAWDHQVERGNIWTIPVSPEQIAAARRGKWEIVVTPTIPVPEKWLPKSLSGWDVLGLASGGGQQGPILAAAGANVTILDQSPKQLGQDHLVAEREGLSIRTVEGVMADLGAFADASFDAVVNPVSTVFAPEVRPVWAEVARVLRPGGRLVAGFCNPAMFIFDLFAAEERGELVVRHALPFADVKDLNEDELQRLIARNDPLEYSHTLDDLIGGQLDAGLVLTGFFEDNWPPQQHDRLPLARHMPLFFATLAVKSG